DGPFHAINRRPRPARTDSDKQPIPVADVCEISRSCGFRLPPSTAVWGTQNPTAPHGDEITAAPANGTNEAGNAKRRFLPMLPVGRTHDNRVPSRPRWVQTVRFIADSHECAAAMGHTLQAALRRLRDRLDPMVQMSRIIIEDLDCLRIGFADLGAIHRTVQQDSESLGPLRKIVLQYLQCDALLGLPSGEGQDAVGSLIILPCHCRAIGSRIANPYRVVHLARALNSYHDLPIAFPHCGGIARTELKASAVGINYPRA